MEIFEQFRRLDLSDQLRTLAASGSRRSQPIDTRLLEYMEKGYVLYVVPKPRWDEYDADRPSIGGSVTITDGTWLWTNHDAYFVRKYGLAVPGVFVDHVHSNGYTIPPEKEIQKKVDSGGGCGAV